MAAAAAIAGDMRWVRPPLPCRPSKLRFEVLAQRSPDESLSGFMARHMEHPGSRHSKPASSMTLSIPSNSARSFTSPDPGTTIARTPSATLLPEAMAATARMSSRRPLVHEPTKTVSIAISSIFSLAVRPMYSRERVMPASRAASPFESTFGSGTKPVTGAVSCGEVPQVTVGGMSAPLMITSLSNLAPSSDLRSRHFSTAASHSAPVGTIGRPLRYSKVISSAGMTPALAPASMAIFEIDIRASMDSFSMALPENSMQQPVPPAVPMMPQTWSTRSLEVTPGASSPSTRISMFLALA
mmetsp:Transcript_73826/g.210582  ORF Transcript_73826/g.210582 Transcript_73826/m.210582 type:complete len:298 (+) Transcript_73826:1139-2032(+)